MCVLLQKARGGSLLLMASRQQQFAYSGGSVSLLQVNRCGVNFTNVMTAVGGPSVYVLLFIG